MNIDLSTEYLHLQLKNPLVVAACPLTGNLQSLHRLEAVGASAVVLQSLFAEQIDHEEYELFRLHEYAAGVNAESEGYFPELESYNTGPEPHLEFLEEAKRHLGIPVIASLNGTSSGKWIRYAKLFELAGADALELNIYFVPTDPDQSAAQVEDQYLEIIAAVAREISIPFAVKIGPYFSSLPNFARRAIHAGASGLVLFNRYLDPELNLETLRVEPHLALSQPSELRLVLRWLGILRDQVDVSLAATSGIHSVDDTLKALMAGANVTMLASTLLQRGPEHLARILGDLEEWLVRRQYVSVKQMIGSVSRDRSADGSAFERANYMKALVSYSKDGHWA